MNELHSMRAHSFRSTALGIVVYLLLEQFRIWVITYPFIRAQTIVVPLAIYCLLIVALLLRLDRRWARLTLYVTSALAAMYQVFLAVPSIVSPFVVVLGNMQEAYGTVVWKSLLEEIQGLLVVVFVLVSALEARAFGKKAAA